VRAVPCRRGRRRAGRLCCECHSQQGPHPTWDAIAGRGWLAATGLLLAAVWLRARVHEHVALQLLHVLWAVLGGQVPAARQQRPPCVSYVSDAPPR
jgi:hypothetical protein